MKSAEESILIKCHNMLLREEVKREIVSIQLDAMREGMRRAAELVFNFPTQSLRQSAKMADATKAILSAAEKLTEKDL